MVNSYTAGNQSNPVVAMDDYGNFVVAWSGEGAQDDLSGVYYRVYDSTGGGHDRSATGQRHHDEHPKRAGRGDGCQRRLRRYAGPATAKTAIATASSPDASTCKAKPSAASSW